MKLWRWLVIDFEIAYLRDVDAGVVRTYTPPDGYLWAPQSIKVNHTDDQAICKILAGRLIQCTSPEDFACDD